jgi:tripartite ATP-independent transporter DctP family solute receptor
MKKNNLVTLLFLTVFLSVFMIGQGTADAKYIIKFAHSEPVKSVIGDAVSKFKSSVEELSKGEVEVRIFPAYQLGTTGEVAEMMQMGFLQMALGSAAHISTLYPPIQVFEIPFLLPEDFKLSTEIINGQPGEILSAGLKKKNIIGVSYINGGWKTFMCNKPIHKPSDFKGLKWRTMPSQLIMETYRVLGANPTPLPYTEIYTALQLGTIDGQENPIWANEAMKFYEVAKYLIISNHSAAIMVQFANSKWIEGLPKDIHKIVLDASIELRKYVMGKNEEENREALEKMKKYGTKIIELTPQERQAFKEALRPVRDKYVSIIGEEGANILKTFDEEIAKAGKIK